MANTAMPNLAQVCQGHIAWRVQSATRAITECAPKEAPAVLRTLIESVFGSAGPAEPGLLGWGLQVFTKAQQPTEYQQLLGFLAAQGPLVTMALRYSQDPFMLFEFPVACLPLTAQAGITEGSPGPLYAGKIQNPGPGKLPHTILLNSFEFYLFHFCYYLLHCADAGCGGLSWTFVGDSVYPTLLEDYLKTFLPCDGTAPPSSHHCSSPTVAAAAASLASSRLQQLSSLMSTAMPMPHARSPYTAALPQPRPAHQRHSAWTSQIVAQILVEMWINQCQPVVASPAAPRSPPHAATSHQGIGPSIMSEHIRAVRMIIKHFHYFSNSIKPAQPLPLDALRRSLWPMCRKSFYQLFVQLLTRWPLDSSFRLLLEAWLSYIQPWRYTDINRSTDTTDATGLVEWRWQPFLADNLLLYSAILGAVLPRLLRLDLAAHRNAHMLYRITKVLSLPNLAPMLQATEQALQCSPLLPASPQQEGGPLPHHTAALAIRQHMLEMEGNHYVYTPIFGGYTQDVVREVLCSVRSAELAVQSELSAATPASGTGRGAGLLSTVVSWLDSVGTVATDNSVEELSRSLLHLQAANQHLMMLFQISPSCVSGEESPSKTAAVPDQVSTPNGPVLTDTGRRQLVAGLKRKDLKYEGDPDLRPISDVEFAMLVRWFYAFALLLNTKYGEVLTRGYHSRGAPGVVWRCVLQPPVVVLEYQKQGSQECGGAFATRRARNLPPRFSFRRAANRQLVLGVLLCCVLLQVVCGMSLPAQLLYVLLPVLLLYTVYQLFRGHAAKPRYV